MTGHSECIVFGLNTFPSQYAVTKAAVQRLRSSLQLVPGACRSKKAINQSIQSVRSIMNIVPAKDMYDIFFRIKPMFV